MTERVAVNSLLRYETRLCERCLGAHSVLHFRARSNVFFPRTRLLGRWTQFEYLGLVLPESWTVVPLTSRDDGSVGRWKLRRVESWSGMALVRPCIQMSYYEWVAWFERNPHRLNQQRCLS